MFSNKKGGSMKKKYLLFLLTIFFMPVMTYASILNEVPPYINIEGIDENNYDITKTIMTDKVIVELTDKETKLSYFWSFDKNKIGENIDLNFEIDFEPLHDEEINELTDNTDKKYISFKHHGEVPENTKVKIYVLDKYKNGELLNLYYYNENTNKVEFIDDNIVVKDGYAEFEIDHCSEYFLTGAIVNNPKQVSKNMNYIIVGLVIVVIGLLTYTMFVKR